jgi:ribosomal protein L7/L12
MNQGQEQRRMARALRIGELRAELQALLDEEAQDLRGSSPVDLNALRSECARMKKMGGGGIIAAIKLYRSRTGLSLREAKDAVDCIPA